MPNLFSGKLLLRQRRTSLTAGRITASLPILLDNTVTSTASDAGADRGAGQADAVDAEVVAPEQRFRFHDLRAYYTTVHKRTRGELPDLHANPEVTARVYDRNREVPRKAL